ncbi:short chain dehydrogenase, partial [Listeria monocytogenes]|nr:short chain dehydrogenase [Listeria monocytogenes]
RLKKASLVHKLVKVIKYINRKRSSP